jgi:hypothetical protein
MSQRDSSIVVSVLVDDVVWTKIDDLADAGSEDRVFVLNSEKGVVTFGDGVHGQQPEVGAQVTVLWSQGEGAEGNTPVTISTSWPPLNQRFQVSTSSHGIGIYPVFSCSEFNPGRKRVRYFTGQLMSAEDFQTEQQYFRDKLRRHNRFLHGYGVVTGFEVAVSQQAASSNVVIFPGYAISAEGEELILAQAFELEINLPLSPQYVTLQYAEHETDPVAELGPDSAAPSRIEEQLLVCLAPEKETPGALTIGRIVSSDSGWVVDRAFPTRGARGHLS